MLARSAPGVHVKSDAAWLLPRPGARRPDELADTITVAAMGGKPVDRRIVHTGRHAIVACEAAHRVSPWQRAEEDNPANTTRRQARRELGDLPAEARAGTTEDTYMADELPDATLPAFVR